MEVGMEAEIGMVVEIGTETEIGMEAEVGTEVEIGTETEVGTETETAVWMVIKVVPVCNNVTNNALNRRGMSDPCSLMTLTRTTRRGITRKISGITREIIRRGTRTRRGRRNYSE